MDNSLVEKNLGIDFGSTYTIMSHYNIENDRVDAIQTQNGSRYIPSVACLDDDDQLLFGQEAKNEMTYSPDLRCFRAFKMLLPEKKRVTLERNGYSDDYCPEYVAKEFLRRYCSVAKKECDLGQQDQFDKLVVCIPDNWKNELDSLSGKAILREICTELDIAKRIQIVTEPAAASAFFAYNFSKKAESHFNGKILIIDYGGGTLDISLTEVTTITRPDGSSAMEIEIRDHTGAGDNHRDRIGAAGLAYMDSVARLALAEAGVEDVVVDGDFLQVVNKLEERLMLHADELADRVMSEYPATFITREMEDDHELFVNCKYNRKKISITYSMLFRAYMDTIYPVLDEQLRDVRSRFDDKGFDPAKDTATSKIAIVGGFGQFILVQQQVLDFFQVCGSDIDITTGTDTGKEDAVSFGASLIASGVITMRKTAPMSIGMRTFVSGKKTFKFAIDYRQELEYDRMYPVGDTWEPILIGPSSDPSETVWAFAVNDGPDKHWATRMIPLPEKLQKLESEVSPGLYYLAFSMDDSEIYSLHVIPCAKTLPWEPLFEQRREPISLGNFYDMFGSVVSIQEDDILYAL